MLPLCIVVSRPWCLLRIGRAAASAKLQRGPLGVNRLGIREHPWRNMPERLARRTDRVRRDSRHEGGSGELPPGAREKARLGVRRPHCLLEVRLPQAPRGRGRRPAADRFPRSPSNWAKLPEPADERAWKADVELLRSEHQALLGAIRAVPFQAYGRPTSGGKQWTYGELILGIAQHDAYHVGQIQLIKRLWGERTRVGRIRTAIRPVPQEIGRTASISLQMTSSLTMGERSQKKRPANPRWASPCSRHA